MCVHKYLAIDSWQCFHIKQRLPKEKKGRRSNQSLEAGVQVTADLVWTPSSGEEAGGIPEDVRNVRDVSQGDFDLLLGPSQLGGKALVFCFGSEIPVRNEL